MATEEREGMNGEPEYEKDDAVDMSAALDDALGRLLAAADEAGIADDTVFGVSSDHGGRDRRHGGPTIAEMTRPVVVSTRW